MHHARRLILIACVATALSADRLHAAAPTGKPQVLQTARQMAARLVISLRRTVPSVRLEQARRDEQPPQGAAAAIALAIDGPHPCDFTPHQYRLPPPAL